MPAHIVDDQLGALEKQGLVEYLAFGDARGWILTERGKERDTQLLREELNESGAAAELAAALVDFEKTLNAQLVRVITEWQLQPSMEQENSSEAVLKELTALAERLDGLMATVVHRLPRFGRYPQQFRQALEQASGGDMRWVAGVGILSCHVVWAELHQDFLSSLGRERTPGAASGNA